MAIVMRYSVYVLLLLAPLECRAENWVEFHTENWQYRSKKLKKKLTFKNRFYYDADTLKITNSGQADVWVKEVAMNDRYYVGKGVPTTEDIFKSIHIWCAAGKYEIVTPETEGAGLDEMNGEEARPGSMYYRLLNSVCINRAE